ncbi:aspartyl-phosphate phosphatase Spo0E family protein [Natranaerobius trueperi]|uniref:Spo0E family sporulation regulatory protein-aspartic acid phosphatase n=1 Tax=Natranaerobius trueperi TaxID=759412 RepID=A0A226C140_9FIRM|nr:aspartyl-phosphate phosphatase Spo0E family protein [Natranaerobius trueperi]OWZ84973.1 hypothetical protein CDO51_00795 [Natranaerobius trueperi]
MSEIEKLKETIEALRMELYELGEVNDFDSEKILKKSQELDKALNEYYRLVYKKDK